MGVAVDWEDGQVRHRCELGLSQIREQETMYGEVVADASLWHLPRWRRPGARARCVSGTARGEGSKAFRIASDPIGSSSCYSEQSLERRSLIDRSLDHESTQIPALLELRSYREASGENGAAKCLRAVLEDLAGYYKASWISSRIRKMEVF